VARKKFRVPAKRHGAPPSNFAKTTPCTVAKPFCNKGFSIASALAGPSGQSGGVPLNSDIRSASSARDVAGQSQKRTAGKVFIEEPLIPRTGARARLR
jgi:hypothetical protein